MKEFRSPSHFWRFFKSRIMESFGSRDGYFFSDLRMDDDIEYYYHTEIDKSIKPIKDSNDENDRPTKKQ